MNENVYFCKEKRERRIFFSITSKTPFVFALLLPVFFFEIYIIIIFHANFPSLSHVHFSLYSKSVLIFFYKLVYNLNLLYVEQK